MTNRDTEVEIDAFRRALRAWWEVLLSAAFLFGSFGGTFVLWVNVVLGVAGLLSLFVPMARRDRSHGAR